jgi:hypothetical protein
MLISVRARQRRKLQTVAFFSAMWGNEKAAGS